MSNVNKLYRCPVCGDILTDEEFKAQTENGGLPYCYCEFGPPKDAPDEGYQRILHEYEVFIKEEK